MDFRINENSEFKIKLDAEKKLIPSEIHSFHRYFGKLIPAIPSFAIKEFTKDGDWVFDPFTGSGTTLVEAKLKGRNAIGMDINPISCFIAKVKTTAINVEILERLNSILLEDIEKDNNPVEIEEIPFCINRDHWFKYFVQENLVKISRNITNFFEKHKIYDLSLEEKQDIIDFYNLTLSSIIRNVSNADTQHVFPGYSKRLRKLDEEGKRKIDVLYTFRNALIKKTRALKDYSNLHQNKIIVENINSKLIDTNKYPKVKLIVTNPPYISSIRYIETMKLELYWMRYILNPDQYRELEKCMIGNDRLYKKEYENIILTPFDYINEIIETIYTLDPKSGNVVGRYFNEMMEVIKNMNKVLEKNAYVVMKISDSKVKKVKVETGKFLTYIANNLGFELVDVFLDEIDNRSLLTKRNIYSDIITHDYIIIWRKVGDINGV